jgi:uncharacterized membrane protein (UPF0127 family)
MIFKMIFKRPRIILIFCIFFACRGNAEEKPQRLASVDLLIETQNENTNSSGGISVSAEIARTESERSKGLMFRRELADGKGMLFVFERDQILSFWMKNTLIPLSIAYIAWNGRIIEILDMEPGDLRSVTSSRSARYALEVPQGWFDRAGVRPGDFLRLDPVLSAGD